MDPDVFALDGVPVSGRLGRLRVHWIEEFNQTPVLDHTLGHRNLELAKKRIIENLQLVVRAKCFLETNR